MNKLLDQAQRNVLARQEEEFRLEVTSEYKKLLYESQKLKADKKTKAKIDTLYKKSKNIWPRNWGDAYPTHNLKGLIKEYAKTGVYHPKTLREIEKEINKRIQY